MRGLKDKEREGRGKDEEGSEMQERLRVERIGIERGGGRKEESGSSLGINWPCYSWIYLSEGRRWNKGSDPG